ncbi:Plasmodesmata-located protein 6 [Hibiscus syriacus]|uniref:Plasmodesmata-located protein 6 n=1 Tax=Hibiscus syriacus TaxID=106335 RepID=A0A6A3CRS2_HIBSY|nr:Plasmodesmata-located protein 6 [Hibiscus syriacus]
MPNSVKSLLHSWMAIPVAALSSGVWKMAFFNTLILCSKTLVDVWVEPSPGYLKFNIDGAVRGNFGATGIGGILRDHKESDSKVVVSWIKNPSCAPACFRGDVLCCSCLCCENSWKIQDIPREGIGQQIAWLK